ncbi:MAG TPA: lysylphosphatidylglycerol synthase transmembrane domain-containing protein [Candidatus Dormibacteraeota bacterium]|nr:lysylphosphatidylglycerol synthase transmembrane domain-containing protein [Candidatus Dormibacteraeota bacterium]
MAPRLSARGAERLRAVLGALRRHWLAALAVVSLAGLVVAVNPGRLAGILRSADPGTLALMVPTVLAISVFRGIAWWVGLRHLGVTISVFRSVYLLFAGRLLVFVPTGDLMRVSILEETGASGRDPGTIAGSIAFQELTFLGLLGLGALPRATSSPEIAGLVAVMVLAHAAVFAIVVWKPAYDWAVALVERIRFLRRFDEPLRHLRPAFVRMMAPSNLAGMLACNAVAAGLMFALFFLSLRAVGVTQVSFAAATFTYGLAHILSGLSFLPGGVGSMEAIVTGLLAAGGVPAYQGAAAAILFRGFNDVVTAAVGAGASVLVKRESHQRGEALDREVPLRGGGSH